MAEGFKTCPFCGNEIKLKISPSTLHAKVICDVCDVTMNKNYKNDKRVSVFIEALIREDWNRRVTDENF